MMCYDSIEDVYKSFINHFDGIDKEIMEAGRRVLKSSEYNYKDDPESFADDLWIELINIFPSISAGNGYF